MNSEAFICCCLVWLCIMLTYIGLILTKIAIEQEKNEQEKI